PEEPVFVLVGADRRVRVPSAIGGKEAALGDITAGEHEVNAVWIARQSTTAQRVGNDGLDRGVAQVGRALRVVVGCRPSERHAVSYLRVGGVVVRGVDVEV